MAFTGQSSFLRFDIAMSVLLFALAIVATGIMGVNSYVGDHHQCFLILDKDKDKAPTESTCTFAVLGSVALAVVALALLGLDYVTFKRSENYKGKKASFTALVLCPIACFFAFIEAGVIGLGLNNLCDMLGADSKAQCIASVKEIKALYAGVTALCLGGLFFAIYGVCEYIQYRRRHVGGDKW